MSAIIIPIHRWRQTVLCATCMKEAPPEGVQCDAWCTFDRELVAKEWRLYATTGRIEQFLSSGSFYGTWHGGRTGAIADLDTCKEVVERACGIQLRRSR